MLNAKVLALAVLNGVGDHERGQWIEDAQFKDGTAHVKRRLTEAEQRMIGDARDIRGTWEATKRMRAIERYVPAGITIVER